MAESHAAVAATGPSASAVRAPSDARLLTLENRLQRLQRVSASSRLSDGQSFRAWALAATAGNELLATPAESGRGVAVKLRYLSSYSEDNVIDPRFFEAVIADAERLAGGGASVALVTPVSSASAMNVDKDALLFRRHAEWRQAYDAFLAATLHYNKLQGEMWDESHARFGEPGHRSQEASERAEEWEAKSEKGMASKAAEEEHERLMDIETGLFEAFAKTPAHTVEGLLLKAKAATEQEELGCRYSGDLLTADIKSLQGIMTGDRSRIGGAS